MKRIAPSLLLVTLAGILLAAPGISFPALGQTEAAGKATPSDASLEVVQVIAAGYPDVLTVELDGAEEAVSELLKMNQYLAHAHASVKLSNNRRAVYPVNYDLELLNQGEPGFVLVPGSIEVPEGVSISPELDGAVLPVFLYDPASPCEMPVVRYEMEVSHVLLHESDTEEAPLLRKLIGQDLYLYLEDGYCWYPKMDWDLSDVQFGTPGTYQIRALPPPESGILLPDSLPPITADVIIQDDGKFQLGPPDFKGFYLNVRWTKETPDISLLRCFYAVGDGDWQENTDGEPVLLGTQSLRIFYSSLEAGVSYYFQLSYDGMDSNILEICLSDEDISYELHEGDRDGGDREEQAPPKLEQPAPTAPATDETAVPETSVPETSGPDIGEPGTSAPDETLPAETLPSGGSSGGDSHSSGGGSHSSSGDSHSSGGDSGGSSSGGSHTAAYSGSASGGPGVTAPSDLETVTKPAVIIPEASAYAAYSSEYAGSGAKPESTPNTPSAEPVSSAAFEEETKDYVVLSGSRMKKLLEHNPGQPVTVTKHRIQLSIPTDTGLFSDLSSHSLLRVELLALSDNTVSIELLMDGIPLTDLPPLTISIPWETNGKDTDFSVTGADGTVIGIAQVQDGILTFTSLQTGTFTIQEIPQSAASHTGSAATVEPSGSGNPDFSGGSDAAPADPPVSEPREQAKTGKTSWVPVSCAAVALALLGLCFRRRTEHRGGKKGGGTR